MDSIVITGRGVVSPIGNSCEAFHRALRAGQAGDGPITRFSVTLPAITRACEVKAFQPLLGTTSFDPFIQFGVAAAEEALVDAGLLKVTVTFGDTHFFESAEMGVPKSDCHQLQGVDPFRVGVVVSSSKGGVTTLERLNTLPLTPGEGAAWFANCAPAELTYQIARRYGIHGPAHCVISACATGTSSVIAAARLIACGEVDIAIAGASDASITPLLLAGYHQLGVCATERIRPFDRDRRGFLVGEGAGIVVLERAAHAAARGATAHATLASYVEASDAHHVTAFHPEAHSVALALETLCRRAQRSTRDIDYINAHGTGTASGDAYESRELRTFLGRSADVTPVSSTKSMTGHMLGASGAIECIATTLALEHSFLPPTIHYDTPDPRCDLDVVPNKARAASLGLALSLSMGFGGHIAAILLEKVKR